MSASSQRKAYEEAERMLAQEHQLVVRSDDPEVRPTLAQMSKAMTNLAALADLKLDDIAEAVIDGDQPTKADLLSSANVTLAREFATWPQGSNLSVILTVDADVLHVLVGEALGTEVAPVHTSIAERSDGLRWYVALRAFLATAPTRHPPILLVDEAEAHLHYDAQADLIRNFSAQALVSQIIYTTHSAGCLPEDLGTGVRLVAPVSGKLYRSVIRNNFWHSAVPGFSPVLIGMGASTLAFMPLRDAVIAEGPSDHLLLPSMLRLVAAIDHLGFQIVPGLSNVSRPGVLELSRTGASVVYLLDHDQGGRDLRDMLIDARIDPLDIIELPTVDGGDAELEDFVSPAALANAVSVLAQKAGYRGEPIDPDRIPRVQRFEFLQQWLKEQVDRELSKPKLAHQLLESRRSHTIVDPDRKGDLLFLFESLRDRLAP